MIEQGSYAFGDTEKPLRRFPKRPFRPSVRATVVLPRLWHSHKVIHARGSDLDAAALAMRVAVDTSMPAMVFKPRNNRRTARCVKKEKRLPVITSRIAKYG
jgi:hypothetical protein